MLTIVRIDHGRASLRLTKGECDEGETRARERVCAFDEVLGVAIVKFEQS
jgi:hypothetical protein